MKEIGLFPLGIVLLPTELVPLHIFEPRYRELIGECLDEVREFGLVHTDGDDVSPVGTRAAVTEVLERFEDGRLNIVVLGGDRFRLHQLTEGRSFPTAEVAPITDLHEPAAPEQMLLARALFDRVVKLTDSGLELPEEALPALSFVLAARLELPVAVKLEMLGSRSERGRLASVIAALETFESTLVRRAEIARVAQRNGHTPHNED
jgi:Lon protease-like protein